MRVCAVGVHYSKVTEWICSLVCLCACMRVCAVGARHSGLFKRLAALSVFLCVYVLWCPSYRVIV